MLVNPITCLGHTDGLFTFTKGKGGIIIPPPSTTHKLIINGLWGKL